MSLAYQIIEDLAPLARHFASPDYDKSISYLQGILPFQVHCFGKQDQHNGWIIPSKYSVRRALIRKDGEIIYDGTKHPLGVVSYSLPFKGKVDLSTLRQHLWYDHRYDEAIPYHFRNSYRPWDRDWGFCVSKTFYDSLEGGEYEVDLEIEEGEPELKLLDYHAPGKSDLEFVFVAHLDHPGMANDDVAGCAVGVELFKWLASQSTKYSYRLLLVQEIIGSQYFLNSFKDNIHEGLFLEMLGVDVALSVQQSLNGGSMMETALQDAFHRAGLEQRFTGFRELAGNDEIVFETYGIPMPSLIRCPYPEYHTNLDNISIIHKEKLNEALDVCKLVVKSLENEIYIQKKFSGLICLSNPDYNLYVDPGQAAFGNYRHGPLRKLMEHMSLMARGDFLSRLCDRFGLEQQEALGYLQRWEELGLIKIT
jgi:aminopeptidase-like protein